MRLIPSDPDVKTVIERIKDGSLDLQPDFQRGSVWPPQKQRLLIDSILRSWYIPPIHVVRTDDENQIVLDGQQRLQAVYDFAENILRVDGHAEPLSAEIRKLDRLTYADLPETARRRFDRFTLRMFEVIDYSSEEPYELFFRLNQPTTLTSAEKRNAFFGPARTQISELSEFAQELGMVQERIGFSNARLAYEDVLARFVWTLERGTLEEKVTAARVTARYRDPEPFDDFIIQLARESIHSFIPSRALDLRDIRLNRAMLHSWLCFTARSVASDGPFESMTGFIRNVESGRIADRHSGNSFMTNEHGTVSLSRAFRILNDRATSRVGDVSSVLLRDAVLWALYTLERPTADVPGSFAELIFSTDISASEVEQRLLAEVAATGWGDLL